MKKINTTKYIFLLALFCVTLGLTAQQDCTNDTTAPTAVCLTGLTTTAIDGFGAVIWTFDIDAGSFDDCSPINFFITTLEDDTGTAPATTSVTLPAVADTYTLVFYVVDAAGNENACFTNVIIDEVSTEGCASDDSPPIPICLNGFTASLNPITGTATIHATDVIIEASDNCTTSPDLSINLEGESTGQPQGATFLTFNEVGTYTVEGWVIDDFGNADYCLTLVIVEESTDCTGDLVLPVAICDDQVLASVFAGETIELTAASVDNGSYDNCSDVDLHLILVADSDGSLPTSTSVTFPAELGIYPIELWVVDAAGNTNACVTNVEVTNVYYGVLGQVFLDENDNCELDDPEVDSGFGGWTIRATDVATGITATAETDTAGFYNIILSLPTDAPRDIFVEFIAPNGISTSCATTRLIEEVTSSVSTELVTNFALGLVEGCNYLTVDVAAPFLRRCFPNDIVIQYNNLSADTVYDVTVRLELDEYLAIQSAAIPYTALGDNAYEFELGAVAGASSGAFTFNALLSCEVSLGFTHCLNAIIEPFTCTIDESYAELVVEGGCDETNDEVYFSVRNIGSDGMATPQQVRIVEDVIMYMNSDPIQLDPGQNEVFSFPASGATWRLEITQDASFPYGGIAAAFVEGCGGFNPGVATQFPIYNLNPNIDELCLENIGSYDPNDKQALPRGFGVSNYIEANTPLEYLVRFQNTGTDTAFTVRIEDQLSEYLDYATIQPGASSHPYRMSLDENGLLMFHFDNIMLPDSNVNLEGSIGFIQFSIQQLPDNRIGTIIENTADIFFDFNEPIITNTVWHTIGEDFIAVNTYEVLEPDASITIAPNPMQAQTRISVEGVALNRGYCLVYDGQGRQVCEVPFQGNNVDISRAAIPISGLYFFKIMGEDRLIAQGKLLVR